MTHRSNTLNTEPSSFQLSCCGQISGGNFGDIDDIYCKYSFSIGPDWSPIAGIDHGISQHARINHMTANDDIVWNFPIDVTFRSTNVFGWPRIAVGVYGLDFFGRDVPRGYGSALIPLTPGTHEIEVPCYRPMASSWLNEWGAWLFGNPIEFYDSKFVCQADGREVTRVRSTGVVKIKVTIATRGMKALGYDCVDNKEFKAPVAPKPEQEVTA